MAYSETHCLLPMSSRRLELSLCNKLLLTPNAAELTDISMAPASADQWKLAAEAYEKGSKEATGKPTAALLEALNTRLPFSKASGILDNGSGPGPYMAKLVETYGRDIAPSCTLICADWAPAMIEQVKRTKIQAIDADPDSLWARVDPQVLDAMDLNSIADESLSHVVAGWVYHIASDPQQCLAETMRVLKPGGVLGVASWKETQWLDAMRPIHKINASLSPPVGSDEFLSSTGLAGVFEKAGFAAVEVSEVHVELPFQTHALFVDILLTKMPPLIALLKGFSEAQTAELRSMMIEEMRGICPSEPGALKGVALVAVGTKE
ncbi:S-adenosyl-L-methionine-dependent methyltransferase [Xylariaceae sp. AK1471]|nr:S-adenosyl-L-methionine-dependent methyltransferase [Xylariaceae sp. AK1471]